MTIFVSLENQWAFEDGVGEDEMKERIRESIVNGTTDLLLLPEQEAVDADPGLCANCGNSLVGTAQMAKERGAEMGEVFCTLSCFESFYGDEQGQEQT